ncbi:immune inhibitor A domain-containing protein [Vibrio caribbeanicus]|uniref:Putative M6 secreted metalloprotease n=1 Tax=Vibrio caribbeanicus ATCC BAA-2122 TaxID=796620 RepID=E3BK89_9VIBR|nr:immune inhibitor A domain-containing protein [Vibrio caribbeanicus]EFP96474.1 putative M6 secreted metalloprotease precursor [Vibrio caribbeanicus ATCC BAA-2122]
MKIMRKSLLASAVLTFCSASSVAQTPIDLGVINEDRVIDMLIAQGKLSPNATIEQRQKALDNFIANKLNSGFKGDAQFGKKALEQRAKILKTIKSKDGLHKAHVFSFDPDKKRTDRVLAVLVDFPDLPWDENRLTDEHTDMLYDSYEPGHYQELLFSNDGYTGPNGENLISMRQYYENESGDSYSVSGQAAGWYRASKEASHYGGNSSTTDNDKNAQALVREALNQLAQDPSINLADYDIEDRYDYDGDGDFREPDGVIDHLMIFHASVGEEAGGGVLSADAIWSHRWNLGQPHVLEGTKSTVPERFDGKYAAFDYTIQPIDAAAGVCAHEYGHDLGLPDEYDTQYTGKGEPVSYWSIMSSGSWAGKIGGTQPTAFSSWAKQYLQASIGGRWINNQTLSLNELEESPVEIKIHQTIDNSNRNMVRIDLPTKRTEGLKPFDGEHAYHSGKGDDLRNSMERKLVISEGTSIKLKFKAWYQIEKDYDFARVLINGKAIEGNITTKDDPYNTGLVPAIAGDSEGWIDAEFDLTQWSGQEVTLAFDYITDGGLAMEGLHIDDIVLDIDGQVVDLDSVENDPTFSLNGYRVNDGFNESEHYYLLQWRSHDNVDEGLKNIKRFGQLMSFEPGLIIWYVDGSMTDNAVGKHPGEGWLGVVDADQNAMVWAESGKPAQTRYQVRDAAFSLKDQTSMRLENNGDVLEDISLIANSSFSDDQDYSNQQAPDSGRLLSEYGVKVEVVDQDESNAFGIVKISKITVPNTTPVSDFSLSIDGLNISVTNNSSDPDGSIESYLWDFGDGNTSTEFSPTWNYSDSGTYTVSLTVVDTEGASHTSSTTVSVKAPNVAPIADAKYIHLGRWVTIWSKSKDPDGRIVDTVWKLADGTIKLGRGFTMIFPSYGTHEVELTVMDDDGQKTTKMITIKI